MSLVVTLIAKSASAYQMRIEPLGQTKMVGGRMINRSLKLDLIPHVPLVFPQKRHHMHCGGLIIIIVEQLGFDLPSRW